MTRPPLTPPDCDLRGLPFMPLDVVRLLDSDMFALSDGNEFKAAVALICKSWHQIPAGSLPQDERVLAHLASISLTDWRTLAERALRGWVLCTDGRLYHKVIAEKALAAWIERIAHRRRSAMGNAKRYGSTFDPAPFDTATDVALDHQKRLNPGAEAAPDQAANLLQGLPQVLKPKTRNLLEGHENHSFKDRTPLPEGGIKAPKGERREREGKEKKTQDAGASPDLSLWESASGSEADQPAANEEGLAGSSFDTWWALHPRPRYRDAAKRVYVEIIRSGRATADELLERLKLWGPTWAAMLATANERYIPSPAKWLTDGGWRDEPPSVGAASDAVRDPNDDGFGAGMFGETPINLDPSSTGIAVWQQRIWMREWLEKPTSWRYERGYAEPGQPGCKVHPTIQAEVRAAYALDPTPTLS